MTTTRYLGSGDMSRHRGDYQPTWPDNLADDVTIEGSVPIGIAEGPEAIGAVLGFARTPYDYQEFNYGDYGDQGFVEDYTSVVQGEPIGSVVVIRFNGGGRAARIVVNQPPAPGLGAALVAPDGRALRRHSLRAVLRDPRRGGAGTTAVIGATGRVGSEIVRGVLARGDAVTAVVRDPGKARRAFGERGGQLVCPMRLDDPRDLTDALDGVRMLFIAMGSIGIDCVLERIAINAAARTASIEQITRLSVLNASADSLAINQRAQDSIDRFAASTAVPYSTIRPTREWAILAGENDHTTGTLQQITGRPPRPVAEFLHDHRAEFV